MQKGGRFAHLGRGDSRLSQETPSVVLQTIRHKKLFQEASLKFEPHLKYRDRVVRTVVDGGNCAKLCTDLCESRNPENVGDSRIFSRIPESSYQVPKKLGLNAVFWLMSCQVSAYLAAPCRSNFFPGCEDNFKTKTFCVIQYKTPFQSFINPFWRLKWDRGVWFQFSQLDKL